MKKLKRIKVLALAKLQAVLLGIIGLLAGITYSFGGLLIDALVSLGWVVTTETPGLSYGTILAFGALPALPILFGGFGFILGIVEAILYNFFAKYFGGIAVEN